MVLKIALSLVLSWAMLAPVLAGELDRARALIDERRYKEARRAIAKVFDEPGKSGECLLLLTRISNELGEWEDAVGFGKQAVRQLPDSAEAHLLYAEALRFKMANVDRMTAMFMVNNYRFAVQRALKLAPSSPEARGEEIGWLLFAPYEAGGDLEAARRKIDELEELDWHRATKWRAELEFKGGTESDGVRMLREVLARHPDDDESRMSLGLRLQAVGEYHDADQNFARVARSSHPALALRAVYQRARTRILGNYDLEEAVTFLLEYIDAVDGRAGVPAESAALWRLGTAYERLGKIADARRAYKRALKLDADHEQARKALEKLPAG